MIAYIDPRKHMPTFYIGFLPSINIFCLSWSMKDFGIPVGISHRLFRQISTKVNINNFLMFLTITDLLISYILDSCYETNLLRY
jgi:hypothetical protein